MTQLTANSIFPQTMLFPLNLSLLITRFLILSDNLYISEMILDLFHNILLLIWARIIKTSHNQKARFVNFMCFVHFYTKDMWFSLST